jgi:FMN hydrolase / 5-amino-6-(5-phospho-D-ribitylamino)uracil phosphatase
MMDWRIQGISFDLDDTLWPVMPVIRQAEIATYDWMVEHCPRVAERYREEDLRALRLQVREAHPHLHHDFTALRREMMRLVFADAGYPHSRVEEAMAVFGRARNDVTLFPDVHPTLDALHRRFPMVALTNGTTDLGEVGIGVFFRHTLHARSIGALKPHPSMFEAAAEHLGLAPEHILHVGDHPVDDIYGGQQAGMRTAWLNRDEAEWAHDHQPDVEIRSLRDLLRLLADEVHTPERESA